MGVVQTFSSADAAALGLDTGPGTLSARVEADEIALLAHERQPAKRWPAFVRAAYEEEIHGRVIRDQHFLFLLGLLVCLSTILIDMVINPAIVKEGAILRVLAVAPVTLLGLIAGARKWRAITAFCVGASPIAFAAVIVHLSIHLPPETAARYLAAAALLMGFANLAMPYSLRGLVIFDVAYIAAVFTISALNRPSPDVDFLILLAIISAGTIQLAHRFESLRQHNFLLTLSARTTSEDLLEANRQLRELSNRDHLTGLPNRRFFNRLFNEMVEDRISADPVHNEQPCGVALMMIDLDHFKAFNDTHGHQAGDEALRIVGHEMAAIFNRYDGVLARYGGEEFVGALAEDAPGDAERVAEEIRRKIATLPLPIGPSGRSLITTSIGIAVSPLYQQTSREELIRQADKALYNAKRSGRNCSEMIEAAA